MKRLTCFTLLALCSMLFASQAMAQTYTGEFLFQQFDFRQIDLLGSGPVAGGVSGNTLVVSSTGGQSQDVANNLAKSTLNWSISFDKTAAASMNTSIVSTPYTGTFTYNQGGPITVIGTGTLIGGPRGNTVYLATSNGRMGVGGVNPTSLPLDDPNTANFNWTMSLNQGDVNNFLGSK